MTFHEKGLLRAMKSAFKGYGYTVAQTESGLVITGDMWGVAIRDDLVPYSVKSLIVLHAGRLPDVEEAMQIHKDEVADEFFNVATQRMHQIKEGLRGGKERILPTRLTMDNKRIWQRVTDLEMAVVDPEHMQILEWSDMDAWAAAGAIAAENVGGIVWVEKEAPEERALMLSHLEQMQFIPSAWVRDE